MPLISKLKAVLGIGSSRRRSRGTPVRVEQEVDAGSERAVKEPATEFDADPATDTGPPAEGSEEPVDSLSGIGPAYSERLSDAGIETVGDLAAADASTLDEATGIGEGRVEDWIERAKNR
jgi:predicted flap endonuclease-1-like 5' DNA nuclease